MKNDSFVLKYIKNIKAFRRTCFVSYQQEVEPHKRIYSFSKKSQ